MQPIKSTNSLDAQKDWLLWCRLCAKDDTQRNISIFIKDEQRQAKDTENGDYNLVEAIKKHFWINICPNDKLPTMICTECFSWVISLVNFSKHVSKVQQMFEHLENSPDDTSMDFKTIRSKYGICDVEHEDALVNEPVMTEVLYIKPNHKQLAECLLKAVDVESNPLELLHSEVAIKEETPLKEDNSGDFSTDNECKSVYKKVEDDVSEENNTRIEDNQQKTYLKRKHSSPEKVKQVKDRTDTKRCDKESISKIQTKPKIQTPPRNFKCAQCPRAFPNRFRLDRHIKTHVPVELRRSMPCSYCNKKFVDELSVQMHIKYVHMEERPFICEECGFATKTRAVLSGHMLTHTNVTPFECEVCKTSFKTRRRLNKHVKIHDSETYPCSECGKQLKSRDTLSRHLLVHSDEAQHNCDYCGRAFKRAKALKTHLIGHTGMKPYSCNFCERSFTAGQNCFSHMKTTHPDELAAFKAAGGAEMYTRIKMPNLEALKAIAKSSKESGYFELEVRRKKAKPK